MHNLVEIAIVRRCGCIGASKNKVPTDVICTKFSCAVLVHILQQPSISETDMGSMSCKCNRLQLQLLWNFMMTDYTYNYFFLNVIDYNYRLHCKVIMIT